MKKKIIMEEDKDKNKSLMSITDIAKKYPDVYASIKNQMSFAINSANIFYENCNSTVLKSITDNVIYFEKQIEANLNKTYFSSLSINLNDLSNNINLTPLTEVIKSLSIGISQIQSNFNKIFNGYINNLVENINNPNSVISTLLMGIEENERSVNCQKVQDLLIKEYGFMFYDLSTTQLLKIKKYPLKIRNACVTRMLYSNTKKKLYREMVQNSFTESPKIMKRENAIIQAYNAHCKSEFYLSIPVFLAQIEGMISDYLVHSKICNRDDYIIHKKGLERKIIKSEIKNKEDMYANIYERVTNYIVDSRNAIMHGNNANYSSAKLSTELLLILLYLTTLFD